MKKTALSLLLLLTLPLHAAQGDELPFPTDEIPSVSGQIQMYREAYLPLNHSEFQTDSHIQELVPLIRVGFSYAGQFLPKEKHPAEYAALKTLWHETVEIIESGRYNIAAMKATNAKIAEILKRVSACHASDENDIAEPQVAFAHPFCFEAVLYDNKGELLLTDFIEQSFVDPNFSMGLHGLPAPKDPATYDPTSLEGPHGGTVVDPLSFLMHDYAHWRGFSRDVTTLSCGLDAEARGELPQVRENFRIRKEFLKNIWDKDKSPLTQVGLFYNPHERFLLSESITFSLETLADLPMHSSQWVREIFSLYENPFNVIWPALGRQLGIFGHIKNEKISENEHKIFFSWGEEFILKVKFSEVDTPNQRFLKSVRVENIEVLKGSFDQTSREKINEIENTTIHATTASQMLADAMADDLKLYQYAYPKDKELQALKFPKFSDSEEAYISIADKLNSYKIRFAEDFHKIARTRPLENNSGK